MPVVRFHHLLIPKPTNDCFPLKWSFSNHMEPIQMELLAQEDETA
jgi:hypothetical protein